MPKTSGDGARIGGLGGGGKGGGGKEGGGERYGTCNNFGWASKSHGGIPPAFDMFSEN